MARRPRPDRTGEAEIAVAALRIAAARPSGEVTTTELKAEIPDWIDLTPSDLERSTTRPNELLFHQVVGNIISHRHDMPGNIIYEGYAEYTGDGIRITEAGRLYLRR
jgi:hypothetical protein